MELAKETWKEPQGWQSPKADSDFTEVDLFLDCVPLDAVLCTCCKHVLNAVMTVSDISRPGAS